MPTKINAEAAPHSWSVETWPKTVYPHTPERARYFLRVHRQELFAAGALVRPGREIVVLGVRFCKWLESKVPNVAEFDRGAARTRDARAPSSGVAA
jgi:hypothetical protein